MVTCKIRLSASLGGRKTVPSYLILCELASYASLSERRRSLGNVSSQFTVCSSQFSAGLRDVAGSPLLNALERLVEVFH